MCRGNACGCGRSSPAPAAVIITAAALAAGSAAAAFIESVAVVVLAVMGVLAVAGIVAFVVLVRRGETLRPPVLPAAVPAARTLAALPGGQPRAIGARRNVIPGVALPADHNTAKMEPRR